MSTSPTPLRAVVFDMDGLMLDTEPLYQAAWQRAAAILGYELDDEFYLTLIGTPTKDALKKVGAYFGPAFPLQRFTKLGADQWYRQVEEHGIDTKPGLLPLLDQLEAAAVPRAVATSSSAKQAAETLEASGLAGRFAHIVTSDQVARGKPAPDLYLEAARRLELPPTACIALEDSEAGVQSAHTAGMTVIMVPDLKKPSPQAESQAYKILSSLHQAAPLIADLLAH
ncbi:MAG: HAD family phosphatase [Gemmatimonadetes bacterium]|nr:HAD family phosphatase [Gemmatimonadota bacterium]MYC71293.1 HAD family phosphatase [Gemmatimonadota bacterium]MYI61427.1 HAD family phosphatase [Gemmatimonadota bacterium]